MGLGGGEKKEYLHELCNEGKDQKQAGYWRTRGKYQPMGKGVGLMGKDQYIRWEKHSRKRGEGIVINNKHRRARRSAGCKNSYGKEKEGRSPTKGGGVQYLRAPQKEGGVPQRRKGVTEGNLTPGTSAQGIMKPRGGPSGKEKVCKT